MPYLDLSRACAETEGYITACRDAIKALESGTLSGSGMTGWLEPERCCTPEELSAIEDTARRIRDRYSAVAVIGVGGSYMGARAVIDAVLGRRANELGASPRIYFAGTGLSAAELSDTVKLTEDEDLCVIVISKSGSTTEPASAFRVFSELLEKKYGTDGARDRTFVITDPQAGTLRELSRERGYKTFPVPRGIGGRYSVLSAVGLLPCAAAGVDIRELIAGAADERRRILDGGAESDSARYAMTRAALEDSGKTVELLAYWEPDLACAAEWWKQLMGESCGKQGRGLFPASALFSTDLHSLGQYIQEGRRTLFETALFIDRPRASLTIPARDGDGLGYLNGKELGWINGQAMTATADAHYSGGVPVGVIRMRDQSAYETGALIYFFEYACAVSCCMSGVDPFDQPGVEVYKRGMLNLLGKDDRRR